MHHFAVYDVEQAKTVHRTEIRINLKIGQKHYIFTIFALSFLLIPPPVLNGNLESIRLKWKKKRVYVTKKLQFIIYVLRVKAKIESSR